MNKAERTAKEGAKLRAEGAALRKCRANILMLARAWYVETHPSPTISRIRKNLRTTPHDWLPALARAIEQEWELKIAASARRKQRKEAKERAS